MITERGYCMIDLGEINLLRISKELTFKKLILQKITWKKLILIGVYLQELTLWD
jgi:hypothetical protein